MSTEHRDMGKSVIIVGAGGCAREVLGLYIDLKREKDVIGFVEERSAQVGEFINGKPIHDITYLDLGSERERPLVILGIGSTKRKRLAHKLHNSGYLFDTVIHPSTIRSRWVHIREGTIIAPGVILTCQIEIGRHVILNLGVSIGHDVKIGDYATLSPGARIMGAVTVGREAFVGTNATILENIEIGAGAIVAAGAVVTKNVPEMTLVAGVPAAVKKTYRSDDEKPW
jgi:sugar O-acyltransferase (sialic acid O-acetyltransferase NeuD family)